MKGLIAMAFGVSTTYLGAFIISEVMVAGEMRWYDMPTLFSVGGVWACSNMMLLGRLKL